MGTITVVGQLKVFGLSIVLGVAFCLFYDLFRALHIKLVKSFVAVFVTDVLYWLILFPVTHSFLLLFCKGNVRAYVLFGILIGFVCCRLTLSKPFLKILLLIIDLIGKLFHLISLPFLAFFSLLDTIFNKLLQAAGNKLKKIFKKRKKLLKEHQ